MIGSAAFFIIYVRIVSLKMPAREELPLIIIFKEIKTLIEDSAVFYTDVIFIF